MHATVTIEGTASILQHRFGESAEAGLSKTTRTVVKAESTPRDEAEKVAYRLDGGGLYLPGSAIGRLLREAGGAHKITGTRKSAKFVVPAATLVTEDAIPLHDAEGKPIKEFEVDSRPVTIPATKGRVMRYRPRIDRWRATFRIRIIDTLLKPQFIQQLLQEGGERLGLGDYRPEKGGPFGTFRVIEWREEK